VEFMNLIQFLVLVSSPALWLLTWWILPKQLPVPLLDPMWCTCGYSRAGLSVGSACPECGRSEVRRISAWSTGLAGLIAATCVGIVVATLILGSYSASGSLWEVGPMVFLAILVTGGLTPWLVFAAVGCTDARVKFSHLAAVGLSQAIVLMGCAIYIGNAFHGNTDAQAGLTFLALPFLTATIGGVIAILVAAVVYFLE
jgi:hypothetical protein